MTCEPPIERETYVPPCVLLAEDDHELRSLVASTLRREGFNVVEARNGTELLEQVGSSLLDRKHRVRFDLIITDLRMPGKSGLDILNGLDQGGITTPVLLMTAFGDERTHVLARRFGAVGVLDKPFDLDQLIALAAEAIWHPADEIAPDASIGPRTDHRIHRRGSRDHSERAVWGAAPSSRP
jgi:DNA-binding response OmpR family regulator